MTTTYIDDRYPESRDYDSNYWSVDGEDLRRLLMRLCAAERANTGTDRTGIPPAPRSRLPGVQQPITALPCSSGSA